MPKLISTKGNLMAAKRRRGLAVTGWELMDRKKSILLRELVSGVDRAVALQKEIDEVFARAYTALKVAQTTGGSCLEAAEAVPVDDTVKLRWRSVMGVELPRVTAAHPDVTTLPYALSDTSSALDEAYLLFDRAKDLLDELSQTECTAYRLAFAIRKAQKRANALSNIVLPGLDRDIARISEELEEKEREQFVRMKVVKARKERDGE